MYICLIYTCIYTKVFEVIQEDMHHLRLSFDIVWQWKTLDYKADWQFTKWSLDDTLVTGLEQAYI